MIVRVGDVWFPVELSRFLGTQPVPFQAWLQWLFHHRERIVQSWQATDPFPDGVLQ